MTWCRVLWYIERMRRRNEASKPHHESTNHRETYRLAPMASPGNIRAGQGTGRASQILRHAPLASSVFGIAVHGTGRATNWRRRACQVIHAGHPTPDAPFCQATQVQTALSHNLEFFVLVYARFHPGVMFSPKCVHHTPHSVVTFLHECNICNKICALHLASNKTVVMSLPIICAITSMTENLVRMPALIYMWAKTCTPSLSDPLTLSVSDSSKSRCRCIKKIDETSEQ